MYPKALTFVPAIIFWLILAAILVARLSLAESSTKRDIEFSYQAKMTAKAWGNVLEGLDTEKTSLKEWIHAVSTTEIVYMRKELNSHRTLTSTPFYCFGTPTWRK